MPQAWIQPENWEFETHRVAPLLCEALCQDETARRNSFVLQGFRALAIVSVAGAWPARIVETRQATSTAVREIDNIIAEEGNQVEVSLFEYREISEDLPIGYLATIESNAQAFRVAERAVKAAVQTAQAAVDTADVANGLADPAAVVEAAVSAVRCARDAVDGAHGDTELLAALEGEGDEEEEVAPHIAEFWKAVERDAKLLATGEEEEGALANSTADLSGCSLWLDGIPVWASRKWADLKQRLPEDEGWRVWTDWYEARFAGQPGNEVLEFGRATIATEDWKQGPGHVNAIIANQIKTGADPILTAVAHAFDELEAVRKIVDLREHAARIRNVLPGDPYQAIGATKDMLEATMRTIVTRRGKTATGNVDFSDLTFRCLSELGLVGKPASEGERHLRRIASSAQRMIGSANELRNSAGTGHGRVVGKEPVVTVADASLVASTGVILAAWLLRHAGDA